MAGAALIGMERVSRRDVAMDREAVAARSLALATDAGSSLETRITAMQVCALMGASGVMPAARQEARSAGSPVLRMAAIATVGSLGGGEDAALLDEIGQAAGDRYVVKAAQSAGGRLRQRLGQ